MWQEVFPSVSKMRDRNYETLLYWYKQECRPSILSLDTCIYPMSVTYTHVFIWHHQGLLLSLVGFFQPCLGSYVVHCGASMVHFGVPSWPFSQLLASCHRKEVGSSRSFSSVGVYRSVSELGALKFVLAISPSSDLGIAHHFFSWTPYSLGNLLSKFHNFSQPVQPVGVWFNRFIELACMEHWF